MLSKINTLSVHGCKHITYVGLDAIAKMTTRKDLLLINNPQLTVTAVRKLHAALPNCRILSDYPDFAAK